MKQYVTRMKQEKEDLIGKIKKASKVVESKPFDMDSKQLELLGEQVKVMRRYLEILTERIKYDTSKEV